MKGLVLALAGAGGAVARWLLSGVRYAPGVVGAAIAVHALWTLHPVAGEMALAAVLLLADRKIP